MDLCYVMLLGRWHIAGGIMMINIYTLIVSQGGFHNNK